VGSDTIKVKPRLPSRTSPDHATTDRPPTFLRFPSVRARTGLSRSTIWRLERQGCFPRHRRISRNAVAWLEAEIADWMQSKAGVEPNGSGEARV
jgi:prophage regulatory protein